MLSCDADGLVFPFPLQRPTLSKGSDVLHDLSDVFPKRPNRDMMEGDHVARNRRRHFSSAIRFPSLLPPSFLKLFRTWRKEDTRTRD